MPVPSSPSQSDPQPVWAKRVGDAAVAADNVAFCAGYDVRPRAEADARLAPFDLQTNAAHLLMLVQCELIPAESGSAAASALRQLRTRSESGEALLRAGCEDIHMSIETLVTELSGPDAGGRLHTARSRNDQVATDMRLWLREEIAAAAEAIQLLADALADHAEQHTETVCHGFTHGQPAMVTSWGHWVMSYLPRVLRVARANAVLLRELTTCPLGAAASFGTGWKIDRNLTTQLLGFRHPTPSGADGIWSRGELESRHAFTLAQLLGHLSGIGQDIILLSSPPRDWLRLADEHVTGSSIMPQKRNPDFAEVTRARAHVAGGIVQSFLGIATALPSGYNRDTQWTKYLAFDAADNARGAAELFADVFRRMQVNAASMREACAIGFLNATDVADYLAQSRRIPFRQCYRVLGSAVRACEKQGQLTREELNRALEAEGLHALTADEWAPLEDPAGLLRSRRQPGNPGPDETRRSIALLRGEIAEESTIVRNSAAEWRAKIEQLWQRLAELAD